MPEPDYSAATFARSPNSLAALMNSGTGNERLWREDELAAIFRHQLSAPVFVDLGRMPSGAAIRLQKLSEAQGLLLKSFSELFHHPSPPLELLELTKDFAKANMNHPGSALPQEVAAALYYTSIAAAAVRLNATISKLHRAALRKGYGWTKSQAWIDDPTKALIGEAIAKLPPKSSP